jgi:hypothetical protein
MKTAVISIRGGTAYAERIPAGMKVVIVDHDCKINAGYAIETAIEVNKPCNDLRPDTKKALRIGGIQIKKGE